MVVVPLMQMEGKFHFAHARIREYAESVVFNKGEDTEFARVEGRPTTSLLYALLPFCLA